MDIYSLLKKSNGALGLIPAAAAAVTFILTEKLTGSMQMTDKWTWLMGVFTAISAGAALLLGKKEKE